MSGFVPTDQQALGRRKQLMGLKFKLFASILLAAFCITQSFETLAFKKVDPRRCVGLVYDSPKAKSPYSTGFLISSKDANRVYFVTCKHCLKSKKRIYVSFSDKPSFCSSIRLLLKVNSDTTTYCKRPTVDLAAIELPNRPEFKSKAISFSSITSEPLKSRSIVSGIDVLTVISTTSIFQDTNVSAPPKRKLLLSFGKICSCDHSNWYKGGSEQAYLVEFVTRANWGYSGCPIFIVNPDDFSRNNLQLLGISKGYNSIEVSNSYRDKSGKIAKVTHNDTVQFTEFNDGLLYVEPAKNLLELIK